MTSDTPTKTKEEPKKPKLSFIQQTILDIKLILRAYKYLLKRWPWVLFQVILNVVVTVFNLMQIKLNGEMMDCITNSSKSEYIVSTGFQLAASFFGSRLTYLIMNKTSDKVYSNIDYVKLDFYSSLLSKDVAFFDENKTGELVSRLNREVSDISYSSLSSIMQSIRHVFKVASILGALFYMYPELTVYIILLNAFRILMTKLFMSKMHDEWDQHTDFYRDMSSLITECLGNVRTVKSFATEKKEVKRFDEVLQKGRSIKVNNFFDYRSIESFLSSFVSISQEVLILVLAGTKVAEGQISIGDLTVFVKNSSELEATAWEFGYLMADISKMVKACKEVFSLMDVEAKIHEKCGGFTKDKNDFKGEIKLHNIDFSYPTQKDTKVLKNVSLDIQAGETVAFVGQSGSGKSTIVSLLERFYDPTGGKIIVDGKELWEYDNEWIKQNIGYVQQEPPLFSGSVEFNIAYGVDTYTQEEIENVIKMANARFVYDQNQFPEGLKTEVGEKGVKLSGGQKQRIAIARALLKNPKILIFDEATSALDAESEHQVQTAIDTLMENSNQTVIIVAHRLSTVKKCDRIFVLEKGQVAESGSHDQLLEKGGAYKELMDKQLGGYESEGSN